MDKVTNLNVGAINPYALTEALVGRKIDWTNKASIEIMEDALETDYSELFDMKFNSPIFAGLKLNKENMAEPVKASEITIRGDNDSDTPDVSELKTLEELKKVGINNINATTIRSGVLTRGILNLKLEVPELDKTISKTRLSKPLANILLGAGAGSSADWTPGNGVWKDMGDFFKDVTEFSDPVQGAIGNCYFIAALSAIAWADPYRIIHRNRATGTGEADRVNAIQFYSKGGGKNAPTKLVEVTDKTIVRTSNNQPIYCRSRDAGEIYPALYEKAFAKWILKTNSDKPDITKTAFGDPVKATAQLNNKSTHYYNTSGRTGSKLFSIVRENSASYKTIHPMTAWTYGSSKDYTGTNVVGNHAYTVLGWAYKNSKSYIILRNPWGVTEPAGLNTYQGVLSFFDKSFWRPINMIGNDGVFAIEANSFQKLFAGLGVAK
ncbi:Calpain family cysteine protease [Mariniphaga anaerophila]|uniref:Calpain family cysteine protease n=1 Tax=Mariniphaga anaerophila TaxID=1484053 RepID=A0A1M4T996_9BACT|nr:C2 family cysteine protease [Mariniphaga anaerophila]SHE41073.1 Calpain family cysteine protease [Mariniphaga anaerophila]